MFYELHRGEERYTSKRLIKRAPGYNDSQRDSKLYLVDRESFDQNKLLERHHGLILLLNL